MCYTLGGNRTLKIKEKRLLKTKIQNMASKRYYVCILDRDKKEKFILYLKKNVIPYSAGKDDSYRSRTRIDFSLNGKEAELMNLGILKELNLPLRINNEG